jgi:hypothetical protein
VNSTEQKTRRVFCQIDVQESHLRIPQPKAKSERICLGKMWICQTVTCYNFVQHSHPSSDFSKPDSKVPRYNMRKMLASENLSIFDLGCGVAQIGCGLAQTVASRLAVRQAARVRISARRPRGGPLPSGSNEEIKSGFRRVVYINYCMCNRLM